MLAAFAWADGINFAIFDDLAHKADRWVTNRILGFFVVILVESIVIRQLLNLSNWRCIGISIVLNFFSAFVGLSVSIISVLSFGQGGLGPFIFASALALFVIRKWAPPRWFWATAIITILLGAPVVFLNPSSPLVTHPLGVRLVFLTICHMLLGFGTTLLTESIAMSIFFKGVMISWFLNRTNVWRVILIANIFSYICIIPFFIHTPPFRY